MQDSTGKRRKVHIVMSMADPGLSEGLASTIQGGLGSSCDVSLVEYSHVGEPLSHAERATVDLFIVDYSAGCFQRIG